jgi:hypothetical protein
LISGIVNDKVNITLEEVKSVFIRNIFLDEDRFNDRAVGLGHTHTPNTHNFFSTYQLFPFSTKKTSHTAGSFFSFRTLYGDNEIIKQF